MSRAVRKENNLSQNQYTGFGLDGFDQIGNDLDECPKQ